MKTHMIIGRSRFLFKLFVLNFLNLFKVTLIRTYKSPINFFKINLLLDVGANIGQYAMHARKGGYKEKIVSFEPLIDAHHILTKASKGDSLWVVHSRCAVGGENSIVDINIAQNSFSSSILPILPSHVLAAPKSKYIGKIETNLITLDSIFNEYNDNNRIFLKIDTQGFEKDVLDGVLKNLKNIYVIQLELSAVILYENQKLYNYFFSFFNENNFSLWSLEPGFSDKETGRMLQFDAIFVNNKAL
jgi:FkbM family methyltransferase